MLRSVAVLQLQRQLLDQQADQLIELADMQAHRRIRSDLAEYVAAHAKSGAIPADPLAEVQQRLDCCSHFFAEAKELHRTSVDSFARFLADGLPQVSLTAVHRASAEVEQAAAELPARLQALAAQLDPRDWDGSAADADLHPELLVCAQGLSLDLPKAASARRALRRLALGDGKLHAEIQAHFQCVRVRLAELPPIHARHRETLQQTAAQVALDNHLTAAQRLKADGLHEQAFRGFSDLDYAKTQTDLAALCATVHAAVSFAEGLPTRCRSVLKRFQELATTSQRDEGRAKANGALAGLHRDFVAHWAKATAQPGSEVEKECRPPLETARFALSQAEPKLQALALEAEATLAVMAAAGAKKRRRNQQLAAVGALIVVGALYILPGEDRAPIVGVVIVVGAFYFRLQKMLRAAVKQAAEAKVMAKVKALAKKQAAEAQVIAEAKPATGKRLEWTGKAMQRAGMKAETVKRTLTQGGTVVAWGRNDKGQTTVPAGLSGVVAIAGVESHTVALKQDGTVVAWGAGGLGQSDFPHYGQTRVPAGLSGVVAIAAGYWHTVALKQDGTVAAWGRNREGQTAVPAGLSGVVAIAAGGDYTVALKQDGTVVAWGGNGYGQTTVPAGLSGVVAMAAGARHTVALKQDGTVVAWGYNASGQTTVPAGLSGVVAMAAGEPHTVALKQDGTVVAWGENGTGQITVPAGLSGVVALAAGVWHTVALKQDGTVVAWGLNRDGQTTVPAGLSGVVAIAAGYWHTVALKLPE